MPDRQFYVDMLSNLTTRVPPGTGSWLVTVAIVFGLFALIAKLVRRSNERLSRYK